MKHFLLQVVITLGFHFTLTAQSWQEVGTGANALKANNDILALCYDNDLLYAGGQFKDASGNYYVAKWTGSNWEQLGTGMGSSYTSALTYPICVDKDHNVYTLARNPANRSCVMKWDGINWSELGTGANALNPNHEIFAVCTDKDGNVYAAGAFHDGVENFNVFKWDGTSWSQVGALNANSNIMALASDSHGNIYAGGWFLGAGKTYVARWDGTTWLHLDIRDEVAAGSVNALYVDKFDNVYAGGSFRNAAGRPFLAKWNGAAWAELDNSSSPLNADWGSSINAITGDDAGNLYVGGGAIRQSSGKFCVKRWNGTYWSEVGEGTTSLNANAQVYSLCTDPTGSLYAGGWFSDGLTEYDGYHYVAKYDHPASVSEAMEAQEMQAWPNPAHDILYVKNRDLAGQYYISDVTGRITKIVPYTTNTGLQALDVSALTMGVYFLKSENNKSFTFYKN
jgi:hypothetical protein